MMQRIFLALCLIVAIVSVSGFVAPVSPVRNVVSMSSHSSGFDLPKALASASFAVTAAAPAFATEGTSEAFGIDNPVEFWVPLGVIVAINLIFFQWARSQPEGEFFGEYDERRN